MKANIFLFSNLLFFLLFGTCFSAVPHGIGGFVLGAKINDYKDQVKMETVLPNRHLQNEGRTRF